MNEPAQPHQQIIDRFSIVVIFDRSLEFMDGDDRSIIGGEGGFVRDL
ncbi:hypothetical protein [Chamaesiphon sp. GL140_3_metabinner_50]|nr:hypothetical protein [Chamaesiphon sp. GL140_3_metabinner_50]